MNQTLTTTYSRQKKKSRCRRRVSTRLETRGIDGEPEELAGTRRGPIGASGARVYPVPAVRHLRRARLKTSRDREAAERLPENWHETRVSRLEHDQRKQPTGEIKLNEKIKITTQTLVRVRCPYRQ